MITLDKLREHIKTKNNDYNLDSKIHIEMLLFYYDLIEKNSEKIISISKTDDMTDEQKASEISILLTFLNSILPENLQLKLFEDSKKFAENLFILQQLSNQLSSIIKNRLKEGFE